MRGLRSPAIAIGLVVGLLLTGLAASPLAHAVRPALTLSTALGAPTTKTAVKGTSFPANTLVDIYFDRAQVGFVATSGRGAFSYSLTVPASAEPGTHTISGVVHNGSFAAQKRFTVRTNWRQYRGDGSGKGHNRFENVLDPSTVPDLDLEASPPGPASLHAAPVTSGSYLYTNGTDGHLRAYDRTTYALKFDVNTTSSVLLPPAVAGKHVITVGAGLIQDRNATTGALIWSATLPPAVGPPTIHMGVVYVVARGSTTLTNGVYAFNLTCATGGGTCTPLWIGPGGGSGSSFFPEMGLAIGAGRVYARLGNDLLAFAIGCGTGGASCPVVGTVTGLATGTAPVFANNYVYSVEGSAVVARRPTCLGCVPAWSGTLPGSAFRAPTVAGSQVYVVQGTRLFVFASSCGAATCSPTWSTDTGGPAPYSPTVANGVVYVPTASDTFAYEANCWTGCTPLWSAGSGGTYSNAPYATVTVSDGKVLSPSSTGLQIYSTSTAPFALKVKTSELRPDPRFARAERRAERRLSAS